jgi:hypothetical protein
MNTISNDTRIALLCELAHQRVVEEARDKYDSNNDCHSDYIIEGDSETSYTEEGQDLFNEYYDYYERVILNHLDLVDNPNYKKEE